MSRSLSLMLGISLAASLVAAACGASGDSPRKVVIDENVCAGTVRLLRMKLGEPNRIVLDNTKHSDNQDRLTVRFDRFPVFVHGEVPPNSTIGSPLSSIQISADAGQEARVDLEPTFTGTYKATCQVSLVEPSGGGRRTVSTEVTFELFEG